VFLASVGGIGTIELAAVSEILAFGTEGQCGDWHSMPGDLIAVETGGSEKGTEPSATATEQLDETELEHMNDDTVPRASPREVLKVAQA
jgi:hypothetical protein